MGYNMFLDDQIDDIDSETGKPIRYPEKFDKTGRSYVLIKTLQQAYDYMDSHGCPDFISFDYDLGPDANGVIQESRELADWMINRDQDQPGFIPDHFSYHVHSANIRAETNLDRLRQYLRVRKERND